MIGKGKGKGKPKAKVMGKSKGKGNAAVAVKYVELKPNLCVALRTVFYYSADPPWDGYLDLVSPLRPFFTECIARIIFLDGQMCTLYKYIYIYTEYKVHIA